MGLLNWNDELRYGYVNNEKKQPLNLEKRPFGLDYFTSMTYFINSNCRVFLISLSGRSYWRICWNLWSQQMNCLREAKLVMKISESEKHFTFEVTVNKLIRRGRNKIALKKLTLNDTSSEIKTSTVTETKNLLIIFRTRRKKGISNG